MTGKVYIVGAGSGDIGLITIKAIECIKKADVIVYDSLMNKNLLSYADDNAELIFAGKRSGNHSLPQEEINKILLNKALENKSVVRLKGGDPLIFGRGGEEALFLEQNGINFEIIPGISSFYSAADYAGIPLTHREISSSFHVFSGHNSKESLNFETIAKLDGTLVFLMGLNNLEGIAHSLVKNGKAASTATAIILDGTLNTQKTIIGTLENISEKYHKEKIDSAPGIFLIGEVINLREKLYWLEKKPLWGRKIIVTRAKKQNRELVDKIEGLGGTAIEFPTIEIKPLQKNERTKQLYKNLNAYDWLIFTSTNAVEIFIDNLFSYGTDIRSIGNARICAIGTSTAKALEERFLKVDVLSDEFVSESFLDKLKEHIKETEKVLIPCSSGSRKVISTGLKDAGISVDVVHLYETILPEYSSTELKNITLGADSITFTSPSTFTNFVKMLSNEQIQFPTELKVYCLGPVTEEAAIKNKITVHKTASEFNINGLLEILTQ